MSSGDDSNPSFRFDPAYHDDGPKTFLGRSGAWNSSDIVRNTLQRPEAAEFLARKLYCFFIDDSRRAATKDLHPRRWRQTLRVKRLLD